MVICLKWPFCGLISVQLLDQVVGFMHDHTATNRICDKVTMGEVGLEIPRFLVHTALKPKPYI